MTAVDIAALVAAGAFVALVVVLWRALARLGPVLDDVRVGVRGLDERTLPLLREMSAAQAANAAELERIGAEVTRLAGDIDRLGGVAEDLTRASASAAQAAAHAEQMTQLIAETVGTPLLKTASTAYALKTALAAKTGRKDRS